MKLFDLIVGCFLSVVFVVLLRRIIRLWRIIGWRCRLGELLQMFGALVGAFGLLSGDLDAAWGLFVLTVGWLIINPEELTRPVKLFRNRHGQSDSEN